MLGGRTGGGGSSTVCSVTNLNYTNKNGPDGFIIAIPAATCNSFYLVVGSSEGRKVGSALGNEDGISVGAFVLVGALVGVKVGSGVGAALGSIVG